LISGGPHTLRSLICSGGVWSQGLGLRDTALVEFVALTIEVKRLWLYPPDRAPKPDDLNAAAKAVAKELKGQVIDFLDAKALEQAVEDAPRIRRGVGTSPKVVIELAQELTVDQVIGVLRAADFAPGDVGLYVLKSAADVWQFREHTRAWSTDKPAQLRDISPARLRSLSLQINLEDNAEIARSIAAVRQVAEALLLPSGGSIRIDGENQPGKAGLTPTSLVAELESRRAFLDKVDFLLPQVEGTQTDHHP
jgi:hypothetical protein